MDIKPHCLTLRMPGEMCFIKNTLAVNFLLEYKQAKDETHWVSEEHSLILERIRNEQKNSQVYLKFKFLRHDAGIYKLRIFSTNFTAGDGRQQASFAQELKEILTAEFEMSEKHESFIRVPRALSYIWGPLDIPPHLRDGPYIDAAVVNHMSGHLSMCTRSFPFSFPLVLQRATRDISFFTKTFNVCEGDQTHVDVSLDSEDPYVDDEDESDCYFEYTLKFLEPGLFVSQVFATKKSKDVTSGRWKRAVQLIGQFLLDIRQDEKGSKQTKEDCNDEIIGHLEIRSSC